MRILYFDLNMGAAGDMITAALLGLYDDPESVCERLNALGIPGVKYVLERGNKRGISGLHMRVEVNGEVEGEKEQARRCDAHHHGDEREHHEHHGSRNGSHHGSHHEHDHHDHHHHKHDADHHHANLSNIKGIIGALGIPENVKTDALSVFELIVQAESAVHGEPIENIHLHEVGTMDAVADVVAASFLIDDLAVGSIYASDVCTGVGSVECAHGILPVPAPATAAILKGIPAYGGTIDGELCTPTGAAIVKYFVSKFAPMPTMRIESIGYGIGTKDLPRANCLRVMLGTAEASTQASDETACAECSMPSFDDEVVELACNIDDMTGEALGFALEQLMDAGALDAYLVPITMKKSRPATMLCVIVKPSDETRIAKRIFELTSTIGVRRCAHGRYILDRDMDERETRYGRFRVKVASGYGVKRCKIEYDDLARFAEEQGISLSEACDLIEKELF